MSRSLATDTALSCREVTELVTDEIERALPDATRPSLSNSSMGNVLALAAVQRTRKSAPNRTGFPGTAARPVASPPRQKHQVGRFLGIPEKRLARRAHLRTHGQTTDKVDDLARARGYGKVRRDFSRADPVPETTFHQRRGASRRVLQELPDLCVVHERRDAHEKTTHGRSLPRSHFLRRASGSRRASREESAARGVPSQRERPSSLRTP